jgi:tetratricopeptide (TPR) repeat protein
VLEEGDSEQAKQWANSAIEYAFPTDFPDAQAEAKLELGGVLSALGRRDEALSAARDALAIQEAKGDRPGMAEAPALLDQL